MDSKQRWLCKILEECRDDQDHLPSWERNWDQIKIYGYMAACFAMQKYLDGDCEALARMLRCFCDAESGGVQYELIDACNSFCNDPYSSKIFVQEVVKSAPEMLKKSPIWFADSFFGGLYMPPKNRQLFFEAFQTLDVDGQQAIIDYMTYDVENNRENEDVDYFQSLTFVLSECQRISGLPLGDSSYYKEYFKLPPRRQPG